MSGIIKNGAVRCPRCQSTDVHLEKSETEMVKHAETASLEEKYRCQHCKRLFSKSV